MFTIKIYTIEKNVIQGESVGTETASGSASAGIHWKLEGREVEETLKELVVRGEEAKYLYPIKALKFSRGTPRVEYIIGVMHLYRNVKNPPPSRETLPVGRSSLVCVLAVPNYMSYEDFYQFSGSFIQNILELRVVRNDGLTDRYSILIRFENQKSADDFYRYYNQRPFSSLEAEICHVLYTADVQYTGSYEHATTPPTGLTELPTCPVCLERFESQISGILTRVCNHSFHSLCISKWTDSSCPVCRYCQQEPEKSTCSVCSISENLWICVICGFVGCGRYQAGHALNHWKKTQHCYTLGARNQDVWDYVGNNYVNWLIQFKTGAKPGSECSYDSGVESAVFVSKMEAIAVESNNLLTNQQENQRQPIVKQVDLGGLAPVSKDKTWIARAERLDAQLSEELSKWSLERMELQGQLATLQGERDILQQERDQLRARVQVQVEGGDDGEVGHLRAQVTELQRRLDTALDEFETEHARAGFYRRHMMGQGISVPPFSEHSKSPESKYIYYGRE